jgi:hypothetical protein
MLRTSYFPWARSFLHWGARTCTSTHTLETLTSTIWPNRNMPTKSWINLPPKYIPSPKRFSTRSCRS